MDLDPRVKRGLTAQLDSRRGLIEAGARPRGWKIGLNAPAIQEKLALKHSVIGFLTDATLVPAGGAHSLADATQPAAEAEIAIELRRDVGDDAAPDEALAAIGSLSGAIEVVDFDRPLDDLEAVLATNVFHRAVVLGAPREDVAVSGVEVDVALDGETRYTVPAAVELADTIVLVADLLDACGERLRAGERIIAGALAPPVPVAPGQDLRCDFGPLGSVTLRFTNEEDR